MRLPGPLPVLRASGRAHAPSWRHRVLHGRAIWPPVLFPAAAASQQHRTVGDAGSVAHVLAAARADP